EGDVLQYDPGAALQERGQVLDLLLQRWPGLAAQDEDLGVPDGGSGWWIHNRSGNGHTGRFLNGAHSFPLRLTTEYSNGTVVRPLPACPAGEAVLGLGVLVQETRRE